MKFNGDYSVLLPGAPQSAADAAASAFPYGNATSTPDPSIIPPLNLDTSLNPIVVTAQRMPVAASSSMSDWFKPPKLFLTLAVLAGAGYFFLNRKK